MFDQFEKVLYLKEALHAYAADLEMHIGSDKAQIVLERVINDFGYWQEHLKSNRGSGTEEEKWENLKSLRLFWDVYVNYPYYSVKDDFSNPESESYVDKAKSILASKAQKKRGAIENPYDVLCIEYVRFGKSGYRNREAFLAARTEKVTGEEFISISKLTRLLKSAGKRGLIKKNKTGYWILA